MKKITITERILKRPVTVFMMSLLVVGFGLFSMANLKITLMPEFNIPVLAISTGYSNVAPEDMSRLVVEPIEGAIMGVDGVDRVESNIRRGGAFIIMELQPGANVQVTETKLREALDRIRPQLPAEAREPVIFQFDPDRAPIMQLSLGSSVLGLDELRQYSEDFIEPRFERLPGVASAETQGGLRRNFYVSLDPAAMSRHRVVPSEVVSAIQQNNVNQPIGNLTAERISYSIRAESMYRSLDEIGLTVIRVTDEGVPIRVSDVATVENTFADISSIEEVNGNNSVTVQIQKQTDANTLDVAHSVIQEMQVMKEELFPESVTMQVLSNEGDFIEQSINNLAQSALVALTVVVLILLLFMGGWRIAFIVAMSIPVSITATFAAMYFAGITLNIISITGLALAIGLLVDNSIVVTESIANRLAQGQKRFQATLEGTNEVAGALLGSTLTTLAVFIPILGVTGITGTVTRDLALTISIAITSSFLASIILIPVLSSLLLKDDQFEKKGRMFRLISLVEKNYGKILFWILRRKYAVTLFVLVVIGSSVYLFRTIPGEFFPESDTGEFNMRVELPVGTQLTVTAERLREYSQTLLDMPEIRTVITSIGRQRRSTDTNLGQLSVLLVDQRERGRSTDEVIAQVEEMLDDPDVELDFHVSGSGPGGMRGGRWGPRGIQVTLYGPDMEMLRELSYRIEERMLQEPEVMSVSNPRSRPGPEFEFHLDRERIARLDVPSMQIANAFGTQVRGSRAGFYREEGREIPIEVRNKRELLQNRDDMFSLELLQLEDSRVPIMALGNFELHQSMQNMSRRDRELVLDMSIMTEAEPDRYRRVIDDIISSDIVLPDGYRYDFTGRTRFQDDSSRQMGIAFIFALLLTYMVMASLFENFRDPFIIMFTVPLAFFGSLLFLFITATPLSVPAYIGIVILVGIVVNNGIVLVDYIHQRIGKTQNMTTESTIVSMRNDETGSGADDQGILPDRQFLIAFLQACKRRMRPILLTAMTTIFSMVPLALELGVGAETWSPLARSVIGGLAFATLLTLFVVPAIVIGISKKRREMFKSGLAFTMPGEGK